MLLSLLELAKMLYGRPKPNVFDNTESKSFAIEAAIEAAEDIAEQIYF